MNTIINFMTFYPSGNAGPPSFKSDQEGTQDHTYSLEWVAESITTITAFKVEYREDDGDRSFLKPRRQRSYYGYTTVSRFPEKLILPMISKFTTALNPVMKR